MVLVLFAFIILFGVIMISIKSMKCQIVETVCFLFFDWAYMWLDAGL